MCDTCGCGEENGFTLHTGKDQHTHEHSHGDQAHSHMHSHDDGHTHEHSHEHSHTHALFTRQEGRKIELNLDIMSQNNLLAQRNRRYFEGRGIFCLNIVSSPGSGKTSILEKTIPALKDKFPVSIIEGDQQTQQDAERIRKSGAPVVQINTGTGCHLDANMIRSAYSALNPGEGSVLIIENVGNLVCPALFDLGEQKRVVVISVTEGEDKPLKYPYMFQSSDLCLINKIDLLPYVDFDIDKVIEYAKSLKPGLEFIKISARTGEGMQDWFDWISKNRQV
ncbi:MAG: hydrogenase nickel incorporation protein HypB [Bacteroidetes bacterium]|nr:hydrogenase nickel incorporation protein HypB [Bacteroidota bacterium]